MTDRELIDLAKRATKNSYAPYSRFRVGAVLECADGTLYGGCNIENAALGCTICAERSAVSAAVSAGKRSFTRLAIYADSSDYCTPCGMCRQVLSEFAPNIEVLCARGDGKYVSYRLPELLPGSFGSENMR